MKNYPTVDLTGDAYLNPAWPGHYRNLNQITSISVHHDASIRPHDYDSVARYKQEAAEHYNRLGPGLQYGYKIDNVGTIFKIRPHNMWLYNVGSAENVTNLAICLDGYFHAPYNQKPTREQYEALGQLLVKLCEQSPEFPATYENVRPHRDYSATACPGDTFAGWVYAVKDKATATSVPSDAVYDWPELQPSTPPPPPPSPVPTPPTITYEAITPAKYYAFVNTHLDNILTGEVVSYYSPGTTFDITRRARYNGDTWLQTPYSVEKFPDRGIPEKDLRVVEPHTDPTPPSPPDPTPVPTPEPPPVPPTSDHDERLSALEALVKGIINFLKRIFNREEIS